MASTVVILLGVLSLATCALSLKATTEGWFRSGKREFLPCPSQCTPSECGQPDSRDLDRPMLDVFADNPNLDGYCYFAQFPGHGLYHARFLENDVNSELSSYFKYVHAGELTRYRDAMGNARPMLVQAWTEANPIVSVSYTDGNDNAVSVYFHNQSLIDFDWQIPYYYAMGFLGGQHIQSAAFNRLSEGLYVDWLKLSIDECRNVMDLEDFDDATFTFRYLMENRNLTLRDFRAHYFGKCILSPSVAVQDILWGHYAVGCVSNVDSPVTNASRLPGVYVGRGFECADVTK